MLNTLLTALSLWTHTLATIIMVGHYLLMMSVYLPALKRSLDDKSLAGTLAGIATGIRPLMLISLVVFAVTGLYLMMGNKAYQGLGQFGNPWSVLMLTKHILIFLMIGLGFRLNAQILKAKENWLPGFTSLLYVTSACGLLVLLLTAFAQAF
jgi:uncharacterized membrane protein